MNQPSAPTAPQPKPLAEAREDRDELIANLKGLAALSGPIGRATMLRAAARIDADGKRLAELQAERNDLDHELRIANGYRVSASPAPETDDAERAHYAHGVAELAMKHRDAAEAEAAALRDALGLAEKALGWITGNDKRTRRVTVEVDSAGNTYEEQEFDGPFAEYDALDAARALRASATFISDQLTPGMKAHYGSIRLWGAATIERLVAERQPPVPPAADEAKK